MNEAGLNGGCFTFERATVVHYYYQGKGYTLTKYNFNNHLNESGTNRPKSFSTKFYIKF